MESLTDGKKDNPKNIKTKRPKKTKRTKIEVSMTHLYKIGLGSFLVLKEELEVASLQNDSRNLHRE
jgi:hypothetical protein